MINPDKLRSHSDSEYFLCKITAYIAFIAGKSGHGSSLSDLDNYVRWAQEFQATYSIAIWGINASWLETAYQFTQYKLKQQQS